MPTIIQQQKAMFYRITWNSCRSHLHRHPPSCNFSIGWTKYQTVRKTLLLIQKQTEMGLGGICTPQWQIQNFPEDGANPSGGANLLFDKNFRNGIKMKKFWPGCTSLVPPRSANATQHAFKTRLTTQSYQDSRGCFISLGPLNPEE